MSDLPQSALCPFGELLDKRILGEFTDADRERLEAHLKGGCPTCGERWKAEETIEGLIHGASEPMVREVERRREPFLDKLKIRIEKEDQLRRDLRRRRRVGMNGILFLIITLGVTLISAEFFWYRTMQIKLARAQRVVADTELSAIRMAIMKRALERGAAAVPNDRVGLLGALSERRLDAPQRMYYQADPSRIDPVSLLLLDPWGKPYVYNRVGDQFTVYSVGVNGQDEGGAGDDVGGVKAILPPPK
ncbi:MAG: type II secretion system protein GspG [Planctomycetota bacterium]